MALNVECPRLSAAPSGWTERDIMLGSGASALHGTLTQPEGAASVPGVLIISGSGPVDRDGNLPGVVNNSLKLLAHGLADHGIASLRIDKRGIGASRAAGPREAELRFDTYVSDAVAWLEMMRRQPRIGRVAILGHSEGALVATLAAQRTTIDRLILLAGAGEPVGKGIERQLAAADMPMQLRDITHQIITALQQKQPVPDVPPALAALFRPSVQPYLASWLPFDPAVELTRVRVPVLVVQGTTDFQITVNDAKRLVAVRPDAILTLIEGMNHVLKQAPVERTANIATYANPDLPLASELLPAMTAFLTE